MMSNFLGQVLHLYKPTEDPQTHVASRYAFNGADPTKILQITLTVNISPMVRNDDGVLVNATDNAMSNRMVEAVLDLLDWKEAARKAHWMLEASKPVGWSTLLDCPKARVLLYCQTQICFDQLKGNLYASGSM